MMKHEMTRRSSLLIIILLFFSLCNTIKINYKNTNNGPVGNLGSFFEEIVELTKSSHNKETDEYIEEFKQTLLELRENFESEFMRTQLENNKSIESNQNELKEKNQLLDEIKEELLRKQSSIDQNQVERETKLGLHSMKKRNQENLEAKLKKLLVELNNLDANIMDMEKQYAQVHKLLSDCIEILTFFLAKEGSNIDIDNILKARNRLNSFIFTAKKISQTSKLASAISLFGSLRTIISKTDFSDKDLVTKVIEKLREMKKIAEESETIELETLITQKTDGNKEILIMKSDIELLSEQIAELAADMNSLESHQMILNKELEAIQAKMGGIKEEIKELESQNKIISEIQRLYESQYLEEKQTLLQANDLANTII